MLKKLYPFILAIILAMNLMFIVGDFNTVSAVSNVPAELKVDGTKIVTVNDPDVEVRLVGVNLPDLKWSNAGDGSNGSSDVRNRIVTALGDWKSNCIRLGVESERWFGLANGQNNNPTSYRNLVDTLIQSASEREKYVILDLHEFKAPLQLDLDFWKDAAVRYKNNPAVLFGLFNEPHGISWNVWRNGGTVDGNTAYGMQDLIEAVRDTGANNICVVGGLDWAYRLKDILTTGGLLLDQKTGGGGSGNGIVYDTHVYPSKGTTSSWEDHVMPMRAVAPVIAGEFGYHADNPVVMGSYKDTANKYQTMLLNWFDKEGGEYGSKMSWTAYSFHATASPPLLTSNITCEPTDYHGKYVYNKLQAIYKNNGIITDPVAEIIPPKSIATSEVVKVIDFDNTGMIDFGKWPGGSSAPVVATEEESVSGSKSKKIVTTAAEGQGVQFALTGATSDITGFDEIRIDIKASRNVNSKIKIRKENQVDSSLTVSSNSAPLPFTTEWTTVTIQRSDFGDFEFLNERLGTRYNSEREKYEPAVLLRMEGLPKSTTFYLDNITFIWKSTGVNIKSMKFTNMYINVDKLLAGTTNIIIDVENATPFKKDDIAFISALYERSTNKLVSLNMDKFAAESFVTTEGIMTENTIPTGKNPDDYYIKLFLMESIERIIPGTDVMIFDKNGASGQ